MIGIGAGLPEVIGQVIMGIPDTGIHFTDHDVLTGIALFPGAPDIGCHHIGLNAIAGRRRDTEFQFAHLNRDFGVDHQLDVNRAATA